MQEYGAFLLVNDRFTDKENIYFLDSMLSLLVEIWYMIKITDLNGLKDTSHDDYAALFCESPEFIYQ